jgi:hypothetical protein
MCSQGWCAILVATKRIGAPESRTPKMMASKRLRFFGTRSNHPEPRSGIRDKKTPGAARRA